MPVTQADLDTLWDFDDPKGSEVRLRASADDLSWTAAEAQEYLTQVARSLGMQRRFREADAVLDGVQDVVDEIGATPVLAARISLERGRLRNSAGAPDESQAYFLAAIDSARDADSIFLVVDALHMLAIVDAAHAHEWTRVALLELDVESDARTRRWEVSLRNNLGWTLFESGRVDEALTEFEAALEAAHAFGTPQQVRWAEDAIAEAREALGPAS